MKRIILIALFFAPGALWAQHWVYHNVGDTVFDRDTIYFFPWWRDTWHDTNMASTDPYVHFGSYPNVVLQKYYTEQPITVIGLAVALTTTLTEVDFFPDLDSFSMQEYIYFYDACPDSFPLKKQIVLNPHAPKRHMKHIMTLTHEDDQSGVCCDYDIRTIVSYPSLYEFYFEDKPVTVTDSFYIGVSYNSRNNRPPEGEQDTYLRYLPYYAGYATWGAPHNCAEGSCNMIPNHTFRLMNTGECRLPDLVPNQWYWYECPEVASFFPIIEIDSSFAYQPPEPYICPPVENFRLGIVQEHSAVLMWNTNSEHDSWQVSYGPSGTAPDDGTIINAPMQVTQATGLDSCRHYVAYVRAVCHDADSTCFSLWSDSLSIYFCDTTGGHGPDPIGIDSPRNALTELLPNPASTQVTVRAHSSLSRITVLDLQGHTLLDRPVAGSETTLSVADWPAGTYLFVIQTDQGSETRKLVKQ